MTKVNDRVSDLINKQVSDGRQIGVQVCAYMDGRRVVDTWAGNMGPDDPRPVRVDSLFCSWSTTKGVTATAIHMLADRGIIDYDARARETGESCAFPRFEFFARAKHLQFLDLSARTINIKEIFI